ncbi:hypothetical protein SDC9_178812 [bioreactor metagenome]|uniref:Uncharacterized protein n=1 Tax=bioreactor metagenome TaxID=1076179 RepID=A0A645GX83_9ZZZZ
MLANFQAVNHRHDDVEYVKLKAVCFNGGQQRVRVRKLPDIGAYAVFGEIVIYKHGNTPQLGFHVIADGDFQHNGYPFETDFVLGSAGFIASAGMHRNSPKRERPGMRPCAVLIDASFRHAPFVRRLPDGNIIFHRFRLPAKIHSIPI